MQCTVNRTAMLDAVKTALKVAGSDQITPELGGILIEANAGDGTVSAISTDIRTYITRRIKAELVEESGVCVLPPIFGEMLRLSDGENVTLHCDAKSPRVLEYSCGRTRFSIPLLDVKKFPRVQVPFPEDAIRVHGLNTLVKRTAFAAETKSEDPHSVAMQFVRLSFDAANTKAEAMNRQYGAETNNPHCADGSMQLIIHEKALRTLSGIVSPSEDLFLGTVDNYAVFMRPDMVFATLLYQGQYTGSSKVIDYIRPQYSALTDSKALRDAAETVAAVFDSGDDSCLDLHFEPESITVSARTACGQSRGVVAATDVTPTPTDGFHYQARYLLNCLQNITGPLKISVDGRGFMLLEANQSRYYVCPRGETKIRAPQAKPAKKAAKTKPAKNKAA